MKLPVHINICLMLCFSNETYVIFVKATHSRLYNNKEYLIMAE